MKFELEGEMDSTFLARAGFVCGTACMAAVYCDKACNERQL